MGQFATRRTDLHLVMVDADLVPNAPEAVRAMLDQSGLSSSSENWLFNGMKVVCAGRIVGVASRWQDCRPIFEVGVQRQKTLVIWWLQAQPFLTNWKRNKSDNSIVLDLREIEWANLGYEGPRKLCIC